MTATMPDEQDTQITFRATTPTEFRALLGQIRDVSQLSGGQIAAKTGMPRSTVYSLCSTSRPGLPSNPEQVRAFVRACGLSDTQVDIVMDLRNRLNNEQENRKVADAANARGSADHHFETVALNTLAARVAAADRPGEGAGAETIRRRALQDVSFINDDDVHVDMDNLTNLLMACSGSPVPRRQRTTLFDLVHFVLGEEVRARRAARLLSLVAVIVFTLVMGLVTLAIFIPATAQVVVTGLVAALLSPLALTARGLGRSRQRKRRSS